MSDPGLGDAGRSVKKPLIAQLYLVSANEHLGS